LLETVEIKNYQGHEHSVLEFDKGVNVIKGPSHEGKSSIWRAIYWALMNRPLGEGFVSYFANKDDETSVALEFDNSVLIRKRSKNKNTYDVDGKELQAVKSDIPDEVKEASQLSEVNLSGQDDPYFLILDSPGSVAKKLNEAVGLDIIDESISKVNSIISKTNMKLKVINEEAIQVGDELESMQWMNEVEPLIHRVDVATRRKSSVLYQYNILQTLALNINQAEKSIKDKSDWLTVEKPYIELLKKIAKSRKLDERIVSLINKVHIIEHFETSINEKEEALRIEDAYIKLSLKVTQRKQLASKVRQLKQLCKRIEATKITLNSANKHVTNLESLHDIKLKSTGACPLCKRAW